MNVRYTDTNICPDCRGRGYLVILVGHRRGNSHTCDCSLCGCTGTLLTARKDMMPKLSPQYAAPVNPRMTVTYIDGDGDIIDIVEVEEVPINATHVSIRLHGSHKFTLHGDSLAVGRVTP